MDMVPPLCALRVLSEDGSKVVRVEREKESARGKIISPVKIAIYSYNVKKDAYVPLSQFDLGHDKAAEFLYISNDARFLVTANIGHYQGNDVIGLRVYSGRGKLLRRWRLRDFLTEDEISGCAMTGATTQWFENGELGNETFTFSGPADPLLGLLGSYTLMRSYNPKVRYYFTLNFKNLTLRRTDFLLSPEDIMGSKKAHKD